jgi:Putative amidoligase enzyme
LIAAFVYPINTSMNITELDAYNLADAVKFNDRLNPRLWDASEHLRDDVRAQLLLIAEDFREFLGIKDLDLKDITISGSNAAYTYTPNSDIDLHLVVAMPDNEVYRELFDAKKFQYNEQHNIKIGGYDVELYVQDAEAPHISQGIYSLLNNDWVQVPRRVKAVVDDTSTENKFKTVGHQIEQAIESGNLQRMDQLATKIKKMRQTGLENHGEFGPENLAFKMLRSQGKIKELYDARNATKDQELSLKEKAPPTKITWGFKTPRVAEDVGMSWDGVSPSTKMFLSENEPTDEEVLKDFIEFCVNELKIEKMPVIKLRRDPQWPVVNRTFGRYTNDTHTLEVAFGQRHIMDVLRTVAHELTHKHQHERDGEKMGSDAGETGSPWENEANARAGILMRDYGRLHPELFADGVIDIGESASGYIPTKKQANDPRFKMALTKDIRPGQLGKEANKLKLKTDSQGQPQVANPNGLFEKLALEFNKFKKTDEDYSPDNPPGPESKPTMPKGTVRVDVSDMYDWYKLGKNISNLKGADKSQFGKGPPSTIVSFGDEDTEHKYIKDLENLGLTTTDIDPVDPKKPKGVPRQKVDPTYNVSESRQLDEVSMRPSSLKQFANSEEAKGIQAGFEAELIFRDTTSDENDGEDMEPDYDMDERCRSISQVVEFFQDDEYGYGLNERQASRLQDSLDEQYMEWLDGEMYNSWRDERDELIKDAWLREKPMSERIHAALVDGLDLTDAQADAVEQLHARREKGEIKGSEMSEEELDMAQQYSEARSIADDILEEDVEQTIEKEDGFYDEVLDDFRNDFYIDDDSGFFDDVGLRWMSDVANSYDLGWPYLTGGGGNDGSRSWEEIGDSLQQAVDMPVKVSSGYHSATRKPGLWIVEPDSSLQPDDREDYGLEIVSPPMPLEQALEKLKQVADWANREGDAYTNESTGLHMGVSVPYKGGDVDYLKLILFLGDEYVLKSFGRAANTYTKSAMSKFKENIKGGRTDPMSVIKLMQHGLLELAQREVQKGVGEGKYTSAHKQDKYIEFRSAGGDWLQGTNPMLGEADDGYVTGSMDKLQNTMMRYAYAMYLASRPDIERREYAKKLYKLIAPEGDSQLALFSQYAAGELTAEQLKKQWAEKTIGKEKKMNQRWKLFQFDKVADQWLPVPGAEWNGYTEDQVKNAVWSKYGREALDSGEYELRNMSEDQQWEVYDVNTGDVLEIVKGKNKGEVADKVYDKYVDQGIGFNVRPYEDPATLTPRAKLAKRISQPKQEPDQTVDITPGNWEFFYEPTGRVLDAVTGISTTQARAVLADVQRRYNDLAAPSIKMRKTGEETPDVAQNFSQNPNPTIQDPNQVRMPNGVPVWEIVEHESGNVIHVFADHTGREAYSQGMAWLRSMGAEPGYEQRFTVRPKMLQPGERNLSAPQDATQRVGTWAIYDVTLGREISRMDNVPWQQANDRADELERSTGHNMSVRGLSENFADGKGPGRAGDSQRHGIPKGATIAELEKAAKSPGRKGQLARWQLNMRRGKAKAK